MASKSVEALRIKWFSILKRRSQISEANKVSTTRRRNEVTKYLLQNKKRFWQVHSDEGLIFHNWTFKIFATNLIYIALLLPLWNGWDGVTDNSSQSIEIESDKSWWPHHHDNQNVFVKWNSKPCFIMPTIAEVNNIVANTGTHPDRISESKNQSSRY